MANKDVLEATIHFQIMNVEQKLNMLKSLDQNLKRAKSDDDVRTVEKDYKRYFAYQMM